MSERTRRDDIDTEHRPDEPPHSDRERDELLGSSNWRRGYDETVRNGPPLDVSVAQPDYRPGRDALAGAGVRGYESGEQWGGGNEGAQSGGTEGDFAPSGDTPSGFGASRGWGRLGGWTHGDTGMQRRQGPKGYKRSDDSIRDDLCEHLMDLGHIDLSDVAIHIHEGCVVLEGTVPERRMKYEIEDIAATTSGVNDVENNLRVPRVRMDDGASGGGTR